MFKRIGPVRTFASPNEQGKKLRVTATRRTDKKFNKNLINVKIVNKIGFVSPGKNLESRSWPHHFGLMIVAACQERPTLPKFVWSP
jgi:hypothetical protein